MATVREDAALDAAPVTDGEGQHILEPWSDREEVHALPEILRPAEELVAVASGTVVRSGRLAESRWLVVLTDRRLLCIRGRAPVTRKVIDMPISAVRSVSATGLWRKMLVLETGFGPLRIGGLTKTEAAEMCQGLDALMRAYARDDDPAAALRLAGIGAGSAAGDHPVAPLTPADIEAAEATDGGDHASRELRELRDEVEGLGVVVKELRGRVDYLDRLLRANVDVRPTTNRNPE